ncbi:MAG: dihydrolipoyl dehydrogenase [Candidatus Methanomethylicota archaeon]|jgi:dihydrolipoamide dehydrogenase|uniref:Dihydrolipoyl dehydrogenase n=1 Tax=Thermoproteota archaeon TaxID=2056631 RepID=A0A520KG26_9CREN|nr:MAG: dihydrolipoyl dehydrogenase [Candidatus Verstraetearchaeota archaeon]TDA38716.1 MAG: dihydrolipoyl dehydrogenase [Candidatus Verstraetearchaeota archaeon]
MKYDVSIIGSGPAGYVCAIRLSQLGKKVVLIEEKEIGGTCLNRGCIPTKALIHLSTLFKSIKDGEKIGINVSGLSIDFNKAKNWVNQIVLKLRSNLEYLLKSYKIDIIKGKAIINEKNELVVNNEKIESDCIVIASGSEPSFIPSIIPDHNKIITSDDIFSISDIPNDLIIIGGGVIGIEMATIFSYLGSNVTIIEIMDQILPGFPRDVIIPVERNLKKSGVNIKLKVKTEKCEYDENKVKVKLENGEVFNGDYVLLAIGRRPNTKNFSNIKVDEKGFIKVNNKMEVNSGIYAIGDVIGPPLLAHKAMEEGYYSAEIIAGIRETMPKLNIPCVVYSDPEIAIIGEKEGDIIGKFPFISCGRAWTIDKTEGFLKIIGDKNGKVIGAQIVGANASEIISEISLAISSSLKIEDICHTVHPHPTLSEVVLEASRASLRKSVHYKSLY